MSKLMQALINLEYPQRHAPFSQEASLVQEINRLYQEATQEMQQNREGFTQHRWVTDSKIAEHVQIRITAELDKMNLHRLADYKRVQAAIVNWNIQKTQSQANPKAVLAVKKALLACTADAHKKQKLYRACSEYKAHLAADIRSTLTDILPNVSRQNNFHLPEPTTSFKKPIRPGEKPSILDEFLSQEAKSSTIQPMIQKNQGLSQAIQKYQAVTTLQRTLLTNKPAATQIEEFKQTLQREKTCIEAHRDSWGVRFMKKVAAVVTFGAAVALGIFSVKGKETSKALDKMLTPTPGSR
jgi:hypothetical protein